LDKMRNIIIAIINFLMIIIIDLKNQYIISKKLEKKIKVL
jgi:hypothetical protein